MSRSVHGGRHELGQNFLHHQPTIEHIVRLVERSTGPIVEIGAGDGSLTRGLAALGRPLTALELDEHRARRLRRVMPQVEVVRVDALVHPITAPVMVGNIPFHLTTPILRMLLDSDRWTDAVLLTQWEVARKRAGVGGSTMMTAQAAPWFQFRLHGRVPAASFTPRPSVDGGILGIERRRRPLVPYVERPTYERFVRQVFTGRGATLERIVGRATGRSPVTARRWLSAAAIESRALPRDLSAEQWAALWSSVSG